MINSPVDKNQQAIHRLRWQWLAIAVSWLLVAGLVWLGLRPVWPYANRWLLVTLFPLGYALWVCWRGLPDNHRAGETEILTTLGWGNHLTLLRGLGIGLMAGFLFSPWPQGIVAWLPMMLYTLVDMADFFDGYLARRFNHSTVLGATLDGDFDAWGTLFVIFLAIWYGQLLWWYLLIGLAKYVYVAGLWWRRQRGLPVGPLSPSIHRRIFAGFQMGFLSVVLWPIVPAVGAAIAGTLFALPTAIGYGRDWLVVTQKVDINSAIYQKWQSRLYRITAVLLPPLLRIALAACLLALATTMIDQSPLATLFADWNWAAPLFWARLFLWVLLVAGTAVLLGVWGRLLSLLLLFPIGFHLIAAGLTLANGLALVLAICLLLLGPGRWALWPVEEPYMVRRLGE